MQSEHYAVIAGGAALRAAQRLNLVTWLLAFVTAAQFVITAVPFFFPRH